MRKIEESLRSIHRELFPDGQSDHWSPSAGELVLAEHARRLTKQAVDEIKARIRDRGHSA